MLSIFAPVVQDASCSKSRYRTAQWVFYIHLQGHRLVPWKDCQWQMKPQFEHHHHFLTHLHLDN
jgi:hypothetical protein